LLQRLNKRDFYKQVGQQFNIETLPLCGNPLCRKGTAIADKYCAHCGWSTAARKCNINKEGWAESEGMQVTTDGVRAKILKLVSNEVRAELMVADALFVKIVDIQNGKLTCKKDAHGLEWAVYDPFARVGFYNPKSVDEDDDKLNANNIKIERINAEQVPKIYQPARQMIRTIWCYLRSEGEGYEHGEQWREQLENAIRVYAESDENKTFMSEQKGTSNAASPYPVSRVTAQTPKNSSSHASCSRRNTSSQPAHSRGALSTIAESDRSDPSSAPGATGHTLFAAAVSAP